MIEIDRVCKAYGRTPVLHDVSMTVPSGGLTSLIGPNGAGKSTLLSMIGRLLPIDAGTIAVGGMDVATSKSNVLARRLTILRQENHVGLRLTVRDLVGFGRYPYSRGRLTADDHDHIDAAIGYLDLDELAGRFLDQLSGGQRQRAFVAMALAQGTEYLLLDEPLNNMDLKHAVSMMHLLRDAADRLGKTVVLVLHDINFASVYSDWIVAMRDGRITADGKPDEIITPDTLRRVFDIDVAIHHLDGQHIGTYYT